MPRLVIDPDQFEERLDAARRSLNELNSIARPSSAAHPLQTARRLLDQRRRRDAAFPEGLFGEPVWDLLLGLFVAHADGEIVNVSRAGKMAMLPDASLARLLQRLVGAGLVTRKSAPENRRVVFVELTPTAVEQMSELLRRLA